MSKPTASSQTPKIPEQGLLGIHHVTAIASDPRRNLEFYGRHLGLRMVKKTVNFDDPQTYHLYYGDRQGNPGSILTFFPWPGARRGVHGAGQASVTTLAVPAGTLEAWAERLSAAGIDVDGAERFGAQVLRFADPDGLRLELADTVDPAVAELGDPWDEGPVPASLAVRGIDRMTLSQSDAEASARFLTEIMGFRPVAEDGERRRFEIGEGGPTTRLDVLAESGLGHGRVAAGSVHHVAFRLPDDEAQRRWQRHLAEEGLGVTQVMDRNYFRSIYFREPGGVLFELATDPPGFTIDEPVESLGSELVLPPFLESSRDSIERVLPSLEPVPVASGGGAS